MSASRPASPGASGRTRAPRLMRMSSEKSSRSGRSALELGSRRPRVVLHEPGEQDELLLGVARVLAPEAGQLADHDVEETLGREDLGERAEAPRDPALLLAHERLERPYRGLPGVDEEQARRLLLLVIRDPGLRGP